jgi:hypothetical protein
MAWSAGVCLLKPFYAFVPLLSYSITSIKSFQLLNLQSAPLLDNLYVLPVAWILGTWHRLEVSCRRYGRYARLGQVVF